MKDIIPSEFDSILQQYQENEIQANKASAVISICIIATCIVTQILSYFDYSYGVDMANRTVFLPLCLLNALFCFIAWEKNFRGAWIKSMLLLGIILLSVGLFAVFNVYMSFIVVLPIMVSSRYFNKKVTHNVSVVTIGLFLISCILNVVLESRSEIVHFIHQETICYNSWSRWIDAVIYIIIPMTGVLIFSMMNSISTGEKGKFLLESRGKYSKRIAVVEADLNMASEIQKSVLPEGSFHVPGGNFHISAAEYTAREVGGDFYDYFMINDHTLAFLIADVSDKGTPAAMFMMSAYKAIRCAVRCCHSLSDAISLANRLICDDNSSGMFLTLWLGIIDTSTGVGKYVNAGHPCPLVRHADGTVTQLVNTPNLFLGNFPDRTPKVNTFSLKCGDVLLLYTDGITDANSSGGQSFSSQGIISTMERCSSGADAVVEGITSSVNTFSAGNPQFDDMTLLAMECVSVDSPIVEKVNVSSDIHGTEAIINKVASILNELDCPDDARRNVSVAVDEICTNICDYAYDGESGPMKLTATAGRNYIILEFVDHGIAFNPLEQNAPVFGGEPSIGGLGIYLTINLADHISYTRRDGQNILEFTVIWDI